MQYTDKIHTIDDIKSAFAPVFEKYSVKKAMLIGSYSKGTSIPYDDIDLVIATAAPITLAQYSDFVGELQNALQTKVDITFEEYVNPFIEQDIKESHVVIYEK